MWVRIDGWEHVHQWTRGEIRRAVREEENYGLELLETLQSVRLCTGVELQALQLYK